MDSFFLRRMTRRTLQDNVYETLRESLMSGEFAPGERLTVRGIAAALGTSTMPAREALRRLTSEGGLEPLSNGATRVPILDVAKLQDLTEIRLVIEGLAIQRAAQQMTGEDLYELDQADRAIRRAVKSGDVRNEPRANERFHFCIYRAAHSAELLRIIEHLWLQVGPWLMWLLRNDTLGKGPRGEAAFRHHRSIVAALKRRDSLEAQRALRADISSAAEVLIDRARRFHSDDESLLPPGASLAGGRRRRGTVKGKAARRRAAAMDKLACRTRRMAERPRSPRGAPGGPG